MSNSASTPSRQWDPAQGVWVGSRALADEADEIPNPLYIFGYGSLMFRPQESFAACERVDGVVEGWRRIWAQRSCDHRGEPHMPGLVVTVLSDAELEALDLRQATDPPSRVHGVAYRIPDEQVAHVLDELDFREKGGYTRAVVEVLPTHSPGGTSTGRNGGPIKALLYTANAENPNFHHPSTLEEAAHIVAWSRGPSGENKKYLFEVDAYLRRVGAECEETFMLTRRVEEVLEKGLDRRGSLDARHRQILVGTVGGDEEGEGEAARGSGAVWQPLGLVAWGSNQHGQLGRRQAHGAVQTQEDEEWPCPSPTSVDLDVAGTVSFQGGSLATALVDHHLTIRQLAAGGGHSAVVTDEDRLYLWGGNEKGQVGGGKHVILDGTSRVHAFPRRVAMVALGHAHTLVLEKDTGKIYGIGANAAEEATGSSSSSSTCRAVGGAPVTLSGGSGGSKKQLRFSWCAAGVRHSAGVTQDGRLVTWGSRKYGEGLPVSVGSWAPRDGGRVVKVCCGWQHTVVLDDRGRVWTMGANKYGQLGWGWKEEEMGKGEEVAGLPRQVNWPAEAEEGSEGGWVEDVACGWSHVLVKTRDGQVWGWGRNTFGQLAHASSNTATTAAAAAANAVPCRLLPLSGCLPNGARVREIACGTESSVLVGDDWSVWACGWNEHGNLGVGDREDRGVWTRVPGFPIREDEGVGRMLVACGGAHVLAVKERVENKMRRGETMKASK